MLVVWVCVSTSSHVEQCHFLSVTAENMLFDDIAQHVQLLCSRDTADNMVFISLFQADSLHLCLSYEKICIFSYLFLSKCTHTVVTAG